MGEKLHDFLYALIDALFNALAIFTLTLGGLILTSSGLDSFTLTPAIVTAFYVALIRFSIRLYQEEGVNLNGLEDLPAVPDVNNSDEKKLFSKRNVKDCMNVICL